MLVSMCGESAFAGNVAVEAYKGLSLGFSPPRDLQKTPSTRISTKKNMLALARGLGWLETHLVTERLQV